MTDVLFLCPIKANGGISSWGNEFIKSFPDEEFRLYHIEIGPDKDSTHIKGLSRLWYGIKAFIRIRADVKAMLRNNPQIKIMHTTTSGSIGSLRDYRMVKTSKKYGLKTILHCHFGNVKELYEQKWIGYYFRKSLVNYDQIWVLDERSANFLRSKPELSSKIFLTPNSIDVPLTCDLRPKNYHKVGFIGNLIPTKGLFELMESVLNSSLDTELHIAGEGSHEIVGRIKSMAGKEFGRKVFFHGRLTNSKALELIEKLDIIALPTYYKFEAFPISILEAMSRGKMVISCPRAAIPEILTSCDGTTCGILIPEKSSKAISDAIKWCQIHPLEADVICQQAYTKVKDNYNKKVIYKTYKKNYRLLLHESEIDA
jgi:glycosyltransferase involved in cell wall biosynthesis